MQINKNISNHYSNDQIDHPGNIELVARNESRRLRTEDRIKETEGADGEQHSRNTYFQVKDEAKEAEAIRCAGGEVAGTL